MTDVRIAQPDLVDRDGNINVHGRSGIYLPITVEDSAGTAQDISAEALFFEIAGKLRVALAAGSDPTQRVIVVTSTDVEGDLSITVGLPFALRDESPTPPQVLWSGVITSYGFKGQPT